MKANGEEGIVDARSLVANRVHLNIWDAGQVWLGTTQKVTGKADKSAKIVYENEPVNEPKSTKKADLLH